MKTISISEAKATLSKQIRHVHRGEEVLILDRGRPVARLIAAGDEDLTSAESELERQGVLRRGSALPVSFWALPRAKDSEATLRAAVKDERDHGW
jgi:prevent-host-death family protein